METDADNNLEIAKSCSSLFLNKKPVEGMKRTANDHSTEGINLGRKLFSVFSDYYCLIRIPHCLFSTLATRRSLLYLSLDSRCCKWKFLSI